MKKHVVLLSLVGMKVLVVGLLLSILFGCEKKKDYSKETQKCLSYVDRYIASDNKILSECFPECKIMYPNMIESCSQICKDFLEAAQEEHKGLIEECHNPKQGDLK